MVFLVAHAFKCPRDIDDVHAMPDQNVRVQAIRIGLEVRPDSFIGPICQRTLIIIPRRPKPFVLRRV